MSTGGGGPIFEQYVDAYWLAQLLLGAIPPILIDCSVVEVHFQSEHLGWQTDDFLIVGQRSSGELRKLAGQVKRTFSVSAIDEDCKATFQDMWRDFHDPNRFLASTDRFAIVTQRGTNTLLEHFAALLDCARAAHDGDDFEHRLGTPGFISAKAAHYCDEIRTIVGELENRTVSTAELWAFLRAIHILSLDLCTATGQVEAMMKTLLAHSTTEPDRIATAGRSWDALLALAGQTMPLAGSFRRDDLPEPLRQRHPVGATGHPMLNALEEHSSSILRAIRSKIGSDTHLGRDGVVQQVIGSLHETQVVLVSGPAGSGKSAIAKAVLDVLSKDCFAFSFRAEEFAEPHFDATLQKNQIPGRAATLQAALATQDRKLVLVESVERLLEKSTRDAFTDLLTIAAQDPTLQIILTCRDYSSDLVRSCFLESTGTVSHSVVEVPPLSDAELEEVEAANPSLSVPLAQPALRRILRNPYILDKALRIRWSAEGSLPRSEREFRALFWRDIVRADHRMANGMPARRGIIFEVIALRRARQLSLYVNCKDLDLSVISVLRTDSLLIASEERDNLVAPAHDVLEDWAILRWIEEHHPTRGQSIRELFEAIGHYPALRRGYRKWVSELVEYDHGSADRLFLEAVSDSSLPAIFRDDTIVSLLRSQSAPAFLQAHRDELLANGNELLKRLIHLLRVACVATPAWLGGTGPLFNVPDGPAWAAVLQLVAANLDQFAPDDYLLLLGLIEDWSRGVNAWVPYPEGSDSAAAIAYALLSRFDNYNSEDERKRTLQIIAKIPNGDRGRFEVLLRGEVNRRDRLSSDLQNMIFAGTDGMSAARDVPDVLRPALLDYLLCSEEHLGSELRYGGPLELETLFGIKQRARYDYFPESAYRTPVFALLRFHPAIGLDFLIRVFNHSAEWYAHPRVQDRIEPPFEMELKFEDGSIQKQWCNQRLWNWYRGTSVGPSVLQSYLMGFERWLLGIAKQQPTSVDQLLLNILRRSESGALTAVVASVATAFPFQCGETLLTLLRCPMCLLLDRHRLATESQAPSRIFGVMQTRPENRIFEDERRESDSLPHRRSDLENAITNLQLESLAARVHQILDQHRKALPPVGEQDDQDRMWRLAMHRMDLRQYHISDGAETTLLPKNDRDGSPESANQCVRLELNDPDPDVKKMVDENAPRFERVQAQMGLCMWALNVFKHEDGARFDPSSWRSRLEQARTANVPSREEQIGTQGAPGIVAAVCVRDHWNEMTAVDQAWCAERVCEEIVRDADNWNHIARAQRFEMSADRSCAWAISSLVDKPMSQGSHRRVQDAFVIALTHPNDEVRWYATLGIAEQLWVANRDLALRSVNAIATEAIIILDLHGIEDGKAYDQRRAYEKIAAEAADMVRQRFWDADSFPENACATLDVAEWHGAEAHNRILAILGKAPTEPATIAAFARAGKVLVSCWHRDHGREESHRQRNYEAETQLSHLVQSFVMLAPLNVAQEILEPILCATDDPPQEIYWFVIGLLGIEDREPNTKHFWSIWELFADRVKLASWIVHLDDRYSRGGELISAMFLGTRWKENVRHWRSLEGYAHHVHALFESLPASSTVLDDYVRFLYHVGEQSLPESFVRIAKRLQAGDPRQMLTKGNTVFMLEVLLQRYVYTKPLELKQDAELRDAVLFLLDVLVENGSSAAFRMRDDFVTPVSVC